MPPVVRLGVLALGLTSASSLIACSSASHQSAQRLPQQAPLTASVVSDPNNDSVSGIAQREVIRRQEQVRRADAAAADAARKQNSGDLEGAVQSYGKALNSLPAER